MPDDSGAIVRHSTGPGTELVTSDGFRHRIAVDSPGDPEAIHDGSEPLRPEGLLERGGDFPAVREPGEDALCRHDVVKIELDLKTLRTFVSQNIATGERRFTHLQGGMQ